MVMDYADGGELFEYVQRKGKIPEIECRHFMQQIIDGSNPAPF